MLQETVAACVALAVASAVVAASVGHLSVGLGLGAGLVLGSINGFLIRESMDRGLPVVTGSLVRLACLSCAGLVAALALGGAAWPVLIGAGAAQLVMAAAGARQGLRA